VQFLAPADVSRQAKRYDLALAPLDKWRDDPADVGLAALAHGLPVVTTRGWLTDDRFRREPLILVAVGGTAGSLGRQRADGPMRCAPGARSRFYEEQFACRWWPHRSSGYVCRVTDPARRGVRRLDAKAMACVSTHAMVLESLRRAPGESDVGAGRRR
jgi:hypothetical protein